MLSDACCGATKQQAGTRTETGARGEPTRSCPQPGFWWNARVRRRDWFLFCVAVTASELGSQALKPSTYWIQVALSVAPLGSKVVDI
ncbi:hypothetical protein GGTG_07966 [Gaeumannomyces tritici R3-111a-1]|uniref:Uncharacterized protein n=1 Tax=Gaeumannomyces tritici (strain R3-111a-1) TaxID=644352 RepID=J3P376_GAET3|nr:hypothetical protein GGTG_07966 [Gaeumannomyces tritici R3-111a-1]EJT74118.1 hypothetical protein GGTG_07966 [Gaeumannomyces tritici R3-111a-1]